MITVLTTFHKEGLDLYGQRFLDSFAKRVDKRIKLLVYAEDCDPVNPDPEQITIYNAKEELSLLQQFKERWKNDPKANGIPQMILKQDAREIGTKNLNGTQLGLLTKSML